ncbi:MAG TPA: glycosyltransferase family 39 protein, partial [Candidatus Tumulicola sp.]
MVRAAPGPSARGNIVAAIAAAVALVLHLASAGRYGYFRDELYFIACAKHLAWGYVDQPPLVAVAAWLSSPAGYSLVALRALPVVAAALTAALAATMAGELGGGRFARVLAALATILTPAYLLLGNTLTTTSFEPLSWTLAAYCAVRIVRGGGATWWIAAS